VFIAIVGANTVGWWQSRRAEDVDRHTAFIGRIVPEVDFNCFADPIYWEVEDMHF
jgi:hypothetical protein